MIALFPEIPARVDDGGSSCWSYTLLGEGGAAHYGTVLNETRPAAKEEYWHTKAVLERFGHNLKIRRRVSRLTHSARRREWHKEMKG